MQNTLCVMWKASNTPHLPKQSCDRTLLAGFSEFRMIGHRQIWQFIINFVLSCTGAFKKHQNKKI